MLSAFNLCLNFKYYFMALDHNAYFCMYLFFLALFHLKFDSSIEFSLVRLLWVMAPIPSWHLNCCHIYIPHNSRKGKHTEAHPREASGTHTPTTPTPYKTSQKKDGHHAPLQVSRVIGPPSDKFLDPLLNVNSQV